MVTIKFESSEFTVDESVTLETMKQEYPQFFERTGPGSVYTFTAHRGGIILRYNLNFGKTTRHTLVFLYTTYKIERRMIPLDLRHRVKSVDQGKRLIDMALDTASLDPKFWLS